MKRFLCIISVGGKDVANITVRATDSADAFRFVQNAQIKIDVTQITPDVPLNRPEALHTSINGISDAISVGDASGVF